MSRSDEKKRKRQQAQFIASLQAVMADPLGRAFVWAMLDRTNIYAPLMANNAGTTSWMIGKRDYGVDLLNDLKNHAFAEVRLMEDEAIARASRDEAEPVEHEPFPADE